jgi:hypothetical protein
MLIDVVDPIDGNEVMVLPVWRALFGKLYRMHAIQVIDLADDLFVRRDDVHMLYDLRRVDHLDLLCC